MKTAISVPDAVFARVDSTAAQLGMSRSEFFARAAERYLAELDRAATTAAIDAALEGVEQDTAFAERAAGQLAPHVEW